MSNKSNQKKNIFSVFFIEFIRIRNIIAWALISFVGFFLGISSLDISSYIIPLLVFWISFFFIASLTFSMNNYYDADSDRINPRRKNINAIASGKITKKTSILLNLVFILITLVVTILYKFEVFLFCIFLMFLGLTYSVPPIRLKGRPGLDVIWHFFGFFLIVIYGSFVAGNVELISWLIAISLGVWSSIAQVGNHIEDYHPDKSSGTKTFAVWIGLDKAKTSILILTILHLILLIPLIILYSIQYYISLFIIILLPILGLVIIRPKKGTFPSNKCWTFYFSIVVGGSVYLSCLVYQILWLYGFETLNLLNNIGINFLT